MSLLCAYRQTMDGMRGRCGSPAIPPDGRTGCKSSLIIDVTRQHISPIRQQRSLMLIVRDT